MASINSVVKKKQFLWLGIVLASVGCVVGGGWYLADARYQGKEQAPATDEPAPDMTGVVDSTFDQKVQQHATTEMQVTAAVMQKQYEEMHRELELVSKGQSSYQHQIDQLNKENAALTAKIATLSNRAGNTPGEPAPNPPSPPPGPEGEPQPTNFPPNDQSSAVLPPTTYYPGNGVTPGSHVEYQPIPVPNQIRRQSFSYGEKHVGPILPYIPSGSFARSILIEGADANASVTGNESTVPMQLRVIGRVEMPNGKSYDATGCFIGLEAWGDVSSERAIVRTRNISCLKNGLTIDQPIQGHVSFMGKNGIKGEVVMRNGKILGWAWGAGFVDGIGQGVQSASEPSVGLGATASLGAGDVMKMGIGGGTSKAAQTLSEYYIKRAEMYHAIIPIGAGNEITVVFQDGFQMKTIEEMSKNSSDKNDKDKEQNQTSSASTSGLGMSGLDTDKMLKKLGQFDKNQFFPSSTTH